MCQLLSNQPFICHEGVNSSNVPKPWSFQFEEWMMPHPQGEAAMTYFVK